jgi:hypothetical protein
MCVWTLSLPLVVSSFNLVFMAKRGRKGGLQRNLDDEGSSSRAPKSSRSVNQGRGQEITGVTLPAEGSLKGWEFGDGVQMACANVGGTFFAIQVGSGCVKIYQVAVHSDVGKEHPTHTQNCLTLTTTIDRAPVLAALLISSRAI